MNLIVIAAILAPPAVFFVFNHTFLKNIQLKWKLPIFNLVYFLICFLAGWHVSSGTTLEQKITEATWVCFIPIILNTIPLLVAFPLVQLLGYLKIDLPIIQFVSNGLLIIVPSFFWYFVGYKIRARMDRTGPLDRTTSQRET
jgi:hypothetical protein